MGIIATTICVAPAIRQALLHIQTTSPVHVIFVYVISPLYTLYLLYPHVHRSENWGSEYHFFFFFCSKLPKWQSQKNQYTFLRFQNPCTFFYIALFYITAPWRPQLCFLIVILDAAGKVIHRTSPIPCLPKVQHAWLPPFNIYIHTTGCVSSPPMN